MRQIAGDVRDVKLHAIRLDRELQEHVKSPPWYDYADVPLAEAVRALMDHLKLSVSWSPEKIEVVKKGGPEKP